MSLLLQSLISRLTCSNYEADSIEFEKSLICFVVVDFGSFFYLDGRKWKYSDSNGMQQNGIECASFEMFSS